MIEFCEFVHCPNSLVGSSLHQFRTEGVGLFPKVRMAPQADLEPVCQL